VVSSDVCALDAFLRKTFASSLMNACEVSLVKDGAPAVVRLEGFRADPGPGGLPLCRAVMFDITERKRAEAALTANEETLRKVNEELERKVAERTTQLTDSVKSLEGEVRRRVHSETALAAAHEELSAHAGRLRDLAGEITHAVQRERRRIATILHEEVQQFLAAIRFRATSLARHEQESVRQGAAEILKLSSQCVATCRSLTFELHPPVLTIEGLTPAIEWLARYITEKHGLRIDVTVEGEIPRPAEDVKLFVFEAARELLFNVAKHAQVDSATVRLRGTAIGGVELTVSDAGLGFDLGAPTLAGQDKIGFGLFSLRERLALLGGSLEIVTAPGQGSRCTVTVPLGRAAVPTPTPTALEPASASPAVGRGAKIRILLVDDHATVRAGLARLLAEEADMEVAGQAGDGREAVEQADRLRPDVILMDIRMPTLDGIEATRAIRSAHPEIRVIGLSMYTGAEHAHVMREAGAETLLSKSGEPENLVAAIRAAAKR
jgi:signal transduction histidine kinase